MLNNPIHEKKEAKFQKILTGILKVLVKELKVRFVLLKNINIYLW